MSNEKKIRESLKELYALKYPNSSIRDEFTSDKLKHRNDLFLVDESCIISFEIKSDKDILKNLRNQVMEYLTYSSEVVIALDIKHKNNFYAKFNDLCDIPEVTLYFIYNHKITSDVKLSLFKKGISLSFPDIFKYLWSSELKIFKSILKGSSKIKSSSSILTKMINYLYSEDERFEISKFIFLRRCFYYNKCDRNKLPKIQNTKIINLIKSKQELFTLYLQKEL